MEPKPLLSRVSYTNRATIPTGVQYENQCPSYTITRENIALDTPVGKKYLEKWEEKALSEIKGQVDLKIRQDLDLLQNYKTRENVPINSYRLIDGVKYPRVTSIITPDMPNIPFIEDHQELGIKLDETFKIWADTGVFPYDEFKDKGNIKTTWDELYKKACEWIDKYGKDVEVNEHSKAVINDEYKYSGELDFKGSFLKRPAIMDVKKTEKIQKSIKDKYFMQMAAYDLANGNSAEIYLIISPFNEPVFTDEKEKYQKMFLQKREEFKKRYGI